MAFRADSSRTVPAAYRLEWAAQSSTAEIFKSEVDSWAPVRIPLSTTSSAVAASSAFDAPPMPASTGSAGSAAPSPLGGSVPPLRNARAVVEATGVRDLPAAPRVVVPSVVYCGLWWVCGTGRRGARELARLIGEW
jgi:hypothetical protein